MRPLLGSFLLVALSAPAAHAEEVPRAPSVWMAPPSADDGRCFRELMTQPESWRETRRHVDVLGYADHMLNRQFTDEELGAWLPQLADWGLDFALEVGAVKPWGKTGAACFEAQRPMWERFRSLGARISAIALDEPLSCVRRDLGELDAYAVEETAQFISLVREHFPGIRIGDIEPYPSIPVDDLLQWIDALQHRLGERGVRGLDFFRLDVDWVHFTLNKGGGWPEVKQLEEACRARGIPFSLIYWAADHPHLQRLGLADDATWYVSTMRQGNDYAIAGGAPDEYVIESWVEAPAHAVPETHEWTFARSVLDFSRRFVAPRTRSARPLLGAIRWDAWHTPTNGPEHGGRGGPVRAMEASLSPRQYQHRAPFFAKAVSEDEVRIDGYTQAIVDREIAYAKGILDYWAFLLYEEGNSMSQGLDLYLSSEHKQDMPFCAIASPNTFGNADMFRDRMQRIVRLVTEPSYLKVAGGRPLLYVFRVNEDWLNAWGGAESARALFEELRAAIRAAGHENPYLVIMNDTAESGKDMLDVLGAEAITAYARSAGGVDGAPYADLTACARAFWEKCAATGAGVVPLAMAGWDRRPRVEHPVPWETWQQPNAGLEKYYASPTPEQLAEHLREAMTWTERHEAQCPAQAVIIYAWNEHDEGGWLCPTLNADGSPNTSRLDAIEQMLDDFGNRD